MPTFTAIALDRLLEPEGASKSVHNPIPDSNSCSSKSVHNPNLEKLGYRIDSSSNSSIDKKPHWAQISPALYTTPEATPLPGSPSSFPPSPYIVNHKRRGPRLLNSSHQDNAHLQRPEQSLGEEEEVVGNVRGGEMEVIASAVSLPATSTFHIDEEEHENDLHVEEVGSSCVGHGAAGAADDLVKLDDASAKRESESTDFFDPQESMSYASTTDEENSGGVERSSNINTSMAEFFDAWDELSSDGGTRTSLHDVEAEMREIRLNLLMEIEKRKQAEAALNNMQNQWRRIAQHFSDVGLTIPPNPAVLGEDEQSHPELAEELRRQLYIARFVSESMGSGAAKAETEMEMESQLESKNFEIARLWDKLHYYEAMNREMSQRNQETIEMARRNWQRRKRRQRWYWGLVAAAVTTGAGALAWSYLPTAKGSTSSNDFAVREENNEAR